MHPCFNSLPGFLRIHFKLRLLTFKALESSNSHICVPYCLGPHSQSHSDRTKAHVLLRIPRVKTGAVSRAFSFCGPLSVEHRPSIITGPGFNSFLQKAHLIGLAYPHRHPSSGSLVVDRKRGSMLNGTWNG